jgi:hypothetical protein
MSDYLDRSVYADIEEEARAERAEWLLLNDDRPTRHEIEMEER